MKDTEFKLLDLLSDSVNDKFEELHKAGAFDDILQKLKGSVSHPWKLELYLHLYCYTLLSVWRSHVVFWVVYINFLVTLGVRLHFLCG